MLHCTAQHCSYHSQMLIVAGGYPYTASTEVFDYTAADSVWRVTSPLPSASTGPRGATLAGQFVVFGGYNDDNDVFSGEVYTWQNNAWTLTGNMQGARAYHAITEVNITSVICMGNH